jgi:hypothetical protein
MREGIEFHRALTFINLFRCCHVDDCSNHQARVLCTSEQGLKVKEIGVAQK